jgi:hypothetical protein
MSYGLLAPKLKRISIEWMFANLKKGSVLDVGSAESTYTQRMVKDGYRVTRNDTRQLHLFTGEKGIIKPVENLLPDEGVYDNIVLLSTLEHIGLETYGNKLVPYPLGYQKAAVERCFLLLNSFGRVLVTVPFGKFRNMGWFYIYDDSMVDNLKSIGVKSEVSYFCYDKERDDYKFVPREGFVVHECFQNTPDLNGEVLIRFGL